jgi:RNA polymerase primary sigma factor
MYDRRKAMKNLALNLAWEASDLVDEDLPDAEDGERNDESYQQPPNFDLSLHQYMKEVNAVPLLSHEETMDLFRRLEESQQELRSMNKRSARVTEVKEDRRILETNISEIKESIVTSNLRLVVYLANRYQNRGISIHDLVQEGNIGLIRAIDKFDYTLGYRFSTYATWWIRQGMLRAIHQQGRLIRIPTHMLEKFQRYMRKSDTAKRNPAGDEDKNGEETRSTDQPEPDAEMINLMEIMRDTLSLDAPMTDDGLDLQEVTRDEHLVAPDDRVIAQDLQAKLRAALTALSLREEIILRLRYGIDLPASHTLEEVGQLFGLTKERIRQIESKAMKRLYKTQGCA